MCSSYLSCCQSSLQVAFASCVLMFDAAQRLAEALPEQFTAAMQPVLQQQLAVDQAEDKGRTCAAIELLCGLLAAGTVFGPGGEPPEL